jgi:uncharacterized protein (TIGR04255 family)
MEISPNLWFGLVMKYKRAPITEAVLELRYARPLDQNVVEKSAEVIGKDYFYNEIEQNINFSLEAKGAKVETIWEGKQLSSLDRADTVIFRRSSFVCSRLAPYLGWEEFTPRAKKAWAALKKHAGAIEISRIGLRYVNRIDVPLRQGETVNVEDYLNFVPRSPGDFTQPMTTYLVQTNRPLGVDECNFMVLSTTVPSPLINTMSLALDLDVSRELNIPKREDELWALIDRMREHKNFVFESCITDRARALFE